MVTQTEVSALLKAHMDDAEQKEDFDAVDPQEFIDYALGKKKKSDRIRQVDAPDIERRKKLRLQRQDLERPHQIKHQMGAYRFFEQKVEGRNEEVNEAVHVKRRFGLNAAWVGERTCHLHIIKCTAAPA